MFWINPLSWLFSLSGHLYCEFLRPLIISPNLNNYQVTHTLFCNAPRSNSFLYFLSSSTHYPILEITPWAVKRYTYLCLHLLLLPSTLCGWHFIILKGNIALSLFRPKKLQWLCTIFYSQCNSLTLTLKSLSQILSLISHWHLCTHILLLHYSRTICSPAYELINKEDISQRKVMPFSSHWDHCVKWNKSTLKTKVKQILSHVKSKDMEEGVWNYETESGLLDMWKGRKGETLGG